jgi:HK97 family phage major capsid protein/HK97 family phage prohead protease|nr:MAG TPA: major capsid protein [Caudoviricetes sp.]
MEIRQLDNGSLHITGYVNITDKPSRVIKSKGIKFVERVEPRCFSKALMTGNNVEFLLNHNKSIHLGSLDEGNLKLIEDNIGLKIDATVNSEEVRQAYAEGGFSGFSYSFLALKDNFREWDNGVELRTLQEIRLIEVSLLDSKTTPAYFGSIVNIEHREENKKDIEIRAFSEKLEDEDKADEKNNLSAIFDSEKFLKIYKQGVNVSMKAIKEKINKLEEEMEGIVNKTESETRAYTSEEDARVEEIKKEIKGLNKLISDKEYIKEFDKSEEKRAEGGYELKNIEMQNEEIRKAIENEKELDITNFKIEERQAMGTPNVPGGNGKSIGNISKTTFSNAILKKATDISELYTYVRKENFGSALHQMPVQKTKITEFANVKELANYAEKEIDFDPIQLAAHKYGNISVISEEALADTGYDIMSELLEQYGESAGNTLDKLMVTGDANVQGLNSFVKDSDGTVQSGAIKVTHPKADTEKVGFKELMKMYNALPRKYAKNGTWVISTQLAGVLNEAVDANGRPLLYTDFTQVPIGGKPTPMLLGRPVVISDYVTSLTEANNNGHKSIAFFGDLNKALILGLRQNFTIKSSTEHAWLKDGIAIKGTMRFDIKRALGEALVVLATAN